MRAHHIAPADLMGLEFVLREEIVLKCFSQEGTQGGLYSMCNANAWQQRSWWGSCMGKLLLLFFCTSVYSSSTRHKRVKLKCNCLSRGSFLLDEGSDAVL